LTALTSCGPSSPAPHNVVSDSGSSARRSLEVLSRSPLVHPASLPSSCLETSCTSSASTICRETLKLSSRRRLLPEGSAFPYRSREKRIPLAFPSGFAAPPDYNQTAGLHPAQKCHRKPIRSSCSISNPESSAHFAADQPRWVPLAQTMRPDAQQSLRSSAPAAGKILNIASSSKRSRYCQGATEQNSASNSQPKPPAWASRT